MERTERLQRWNGLLAPCAVPFSGRKGRMFEETGDETRFTFQRDRDRIIHTLAFRRLQGKTQVFVSGEGDHYRSRLTHTMEVAQISRDMARTLMLNEDLAECIALAHDLGHPPFGHAGEEALDAWMRTRKKDVPKGKALFEHNLQSYRVVTVLEDHASAYKGLNLNREVLYGLLKHTSPYDRPAGLPKDFGTSLEAQIVDLADEIAYTGHDVDDGLRAKLFSINDLKEIPFAKEAITRSRKRDTSIRGALIHLLVNDIYTLAHDTLPTYGSVADVERAQETILVFSRGMAMRIKQLRTFLWNRMYQHPRVRSRTEEGQRIVRVLCERLSAEPTKKVLDLQKKTGGTLSEAVKDYIAGMTDTFAREQAEA